MLQAGLEGEPTWKTPRVPPAQSPGITPLTQEADSQTSTTKAAPAVPQEVQLNAFVNNYVESIVSEAKSELLAEEWQESSTQGGAPETPQSLAFTQGSSAGSTATPHKGRSGSARAGQGPHRAQPSPMQVPLAQHADAAGRQQHQQDADVPVSSSFTHAAPDLQVQAPSSSWLEAQQEKQVDDAVSSNLQAAAEPEVGPASNGDNAARTGSSSDQAGRKLIEDNEGETASGGKQTGKDEAVLFEGKDVDADAASMVSEIVQGIVHAVSEPTHADQVRTYSLLP